jgi:hypothetical protein
LYRERERETREREREREREMGYVTVVIFSNYTPLDQEGEPCKYRFPLMIGHLLFPSASTS